MAGRKECLGTDRTGRDAWRGRLVVDAYTLARLPSIAMSLRSVWLSFLVVAAIVLAGRPASAENPNQVFSGKIMMSSKRFPLQARSASAYTAQIRKQAQTSFVESKDTHSWKIYFAGFLKTPLNDLEYVIKLFDLSGGGQKLLLSFDQFTDARGQQTITSAMTLEKKLVGVNKELLMTMESKGKVLASSKFKIVGEGERRTGKVDFTAEEAAGKIEED